MAARIGQYISTKPRPPDPAAVCWSWVGRWFRVDGGTYDQMVVSQAERTVVAARHGGVAQFAVTLRPVRGGRCPPPDVP